VIVKYVLMLCSDVAFRDDLEDAAIETGCANWSADLAERGIRPEDVIGGVKLVGAKEIGQLIDQADVIWNW